MGNGLREKINGQKYIYMYIYIYIYISIYLYTRASLEMIFKLAAKSNDKNTIKNKNNNNI